MRQSALICFALLIQSVLTLTTVQAQTSVSYREVSEAQALWASTRGEFSQIEAQFFLKSGPGFGAAPHYWVAIGTDKRPIAVDGFGRFQLPDLPAEAAARAIIESDDDSGPARLVTEIWIKADGLPFPYRRLVEAASEVDRLKGRLIDKALGGAAFLVRGFIPSTRNLDITFEPVAEDCALVLTYKDGDATRLSVKVPEQARLALKPVYERENPMVSATCPIRSIKPANDKVSPDAPRYKDLLARDSRCRDIEARFDLMVCAPILKFKGPNRPKGYVSVEELGEESDLSADIGPVEVWVEHQGERVRIPINAYGQFALPDRPDLEAANPPIESNLAAAYLEPAISVAFVRPPATIDAKLARAYLTQADGMVRAFLGAVLAAVVPAFDHVGLAVDDDRPACGIEVSRAGGTEFLAQKPKTYLWVSADELGGEVRALAPKCPLRSFILRAKSLILAIDLTEKGFHYVRRADFLAATARP